MYVRKTLTISRPLAAIFSFRDNENSSHADVKYLIETQIGITVNSIQFDPLDVRVSKLGVRSRWIVDFFSLADLDKVIKNGLILGTDKIKIFRHDNIASSESSTFKYFKTITNANKKRSKLSNTPS